MLPDLSSDHSPLLISLLSDKSGKNSNGFWKLNNSLVYHEVYVDKTKNIFTKMNHLNEYMENEETKCEFLKYQIRKITIDYSKAIAKNGKKPED